MNEPTCPECGLPVIEFSYSNGTSWYHLIDGMPQPSSPACVPPRWQETVTYDQLREMSKAAKKLGAKAGQKVTATYQLVDGARVMVPDSVKVTE